MTETTMSNETQLPKELQILEEIKNQPKMTVKTKGEFIVISYCDKIYHRMEYALAVVWFIVSETGKQLHFVSDPQTHSALEQYYQEQIVSSLFNA
jgi:hypothetical protein